MGKFDGILICSDIDGTFTGSEEIILENKKAVEYFKKEGGKFTFTTGRNVDYLLKMNLLDCINAPACLVNGSIIYDYEKRVVLKKTPLGFSLKTFLEFISDYQGENFEITAHNGYEEGESFSFDYQCIPSGLNDSFPLKIVCRFPSAESADDFKKFALTKAQFGGCYIAKSWNSGVEFNSISSTKGNAIRFIKEYLKTIHTSVGVGDYENDIPLLMGADIGVCVANGLDRVKAAADIIVKRNDEYAIADLINLLGERVDL